MISKEQLRKTLVRYWSTEDHSFIVQSSLMPHVFVGVGETAQEANAEFEHALEDNFDEVIADNVAGYKIGRPAKGYIAFNANIRPSSKQKIAALSIDMDISQGEVIDYLVFYRECKMQELDLFPRQSNVFEIRHTDLRCSAPAFDMAQIYESMNVAYLEANQSAYRAYSVADFAKAQSNSDKAIIAVSRNQLPLKNPSVPGLPAPFFAVSEDNVGV